VGADSKCPECGAFAWVKDMKTNRQLANTVSMCAKIRMLIGSDGEDHDNVESKTHRNTGSSEGNTCECYLIITVQKSALPDCQTSLNECFNYGKFHERVQTSQYRHHK